MNWCFSRKARSGPLSPYASSAVTPPNGVLSAVRGPGAGQVELPVDQRPSLRPGIGQEHPDLAIRDLPGGPGVLLLHDNPNPSQVSVSQTMALILADVSGTPGAGRLRCHAEQYAAWPVPASGRGGLP